MSTMNIESFEKVYSDPVPVNGHILVEVVDKDTTRKTRGGIILNEETVTGSTSPYFVVQDMGELTNKLNLQIGDIVTFTERNIIFFYGRDMKKLALIHIDKIAAIHRKAEGKKVPYQKDESKSKLIVPDSKIILNN